MLQPRWQKFLFNASYWLALPILVSLTSMLPGILVTQSTLLLLYLIAVLYTSLRAAQMEVLSCAVVCYLLFSYFHAPPIFSFQIHAPDERLSVGVFVVFALLAGRIAGRLSQQLTRLQEQQAFFIAQASFNQGLQDVHEEAALVPLLNACFEPLFHGDVRFTMRTPPHSDAAAQLELGWISKDPVEADSPWAAMLKSMKEQVGIVLDRMRAARTLKETERKNDEERLRSALLASVSHDLKTPLVTMLGAATTLRDLQQDLSPIDARDLLDSIISETRRLESYIQNLLDMTLLHQGKLALTRAWVALEEIWHAVEKRIGRLMDVGRLEFRQHGPLPVLFVQPALVQQALFNALENALKASAAEDSILVQASCDDDSITIRICDKGPGLPVSEWEAVFEQFYTFNMGDHYEKGTGLGLSICRSIMRVHGGNARIVPPLPGYGHCLELTLPVTPTPADDGEEHE